MYKSPIIVILGLAWLGASAGLAAGKEVGVDNVLEKYVKAIGGKEAWDKIESRHIKADLDAFGSTAEWTLDAKAPNLRTTRVELPGIGLLQDGFDGKTAWAKSPAGVSAKTGEELERARKEADFRREIRLKELYPDLAAKGAETFNGQAVQVLESQPSPGNRTRFSFNADSGLLVRVQADFMTNVGSPGTVETELSDYREVDGIKYPHIQKIKFSAAGQQFEIGLKVKEIKHREKFDDAKFKKPE